MLSSLWIHGYDHKLNYSHITPCHNKKQTTALVYWFCTNHLYKCWFQSRKLPFLSCITRLYVDAKHGEAKHYTKYFSATVFVKTNHKKTVMFYKKKNLLEKPIDFYTVLYHFASEIITPFEILSVGYSRNVYCNNKEDIKYEETTCHTHWRRGTTHGWTLLLYRLYKKSRTGLILSEWLLIK